VETDEFQQSLYDVQQRIARLPSLALSLATSF
jgi:hypothetical protein